MFRSIRCKPSCRSSENSSKRSDGGRGDRGRQKSKSNIKVILTAKKFIAEKLHRLENIRIPADFDFHSMNSLTIEPGKNCPESSPENIGKPRAYPEFHPRRKCSLGKIRKIGVVVPRGTTNPQTPFKIIKPRDSTNVIISIFFPNKHQRRHVPRGHIYKTLKQKQNKKEAAI